jgi:hypothetical protein
MWRSVLVMVACGLVAVESARAEWEVGLGAGYSSVDLGGAFDGDGGIRLEPRVSFSLEAVPQIRLGFGLGLSGYATDLDDGEVIRVDGESIFIEEDGVESLSLLEPEFQISWRQPLGGEDRRGFYIEGGVGLGGVIANYGVSDEWGWDLEESEWDATVGVRPFVRGAYQWDDWRVGVEGSYMFGGDLNLNNRAEGDVTEWYVGGFFGYRF